MEEIREAALAYYENGGEELKQLARNFFNCLDEDGDGTVDLREFIKIFGEGGNRLINNHNFFQAHDRDGNGCLDFYEVLSLYYIIKSGRPFCDGCGSFLKGLYFTCLNCHESSDTTFDLCSACYRRKSFSHQHAIFLDNYTLLAYKRSAMLAYQTQRPTGQPSTNQVTSSTRGSTSIQPYNSRLRKANEALRVLDSAVSIATNTVQFASSCAIL